MPTAMTLPKEQKGSAEPWFRITGLAWTNKSFVILNFHNLSFFSKETLKLPQKESRFLKKA
jgi:hypothetical protein